MGEKSKNNVKESPPPKKKKISKQKCMWKEREKLDKDIQYYSWNMTYNID